MSKRIGRGNPRYVEEVSRTGARAAVFEVDRVS